MISLLDDATLRSADGYSAADVFFFGVNTGVRLGYAHGSAWTAMVDPVTGVEAQALAPATGPWGSFSQLMVDQCQVGVHVVWCVYCHCRRCVPVLPFRCQHAQSSCSLLLSDFGFVTWYRQAEPSDQQIFQRPAAPEFLGQHPDVSICQCDW